MHIEIKTLPALRLAYLRWTGPYGHPGIHQTWQRFATWCEQHRDQIVNGRSYGIGQDSPSATPPDKCRYDCCAEVRPDFQPEGDIGVQDFAGGCYACASFTGTGADIHAAWTSLYRDWLPHSGYQVAEGAGIEVMEPDFMVDAQTGTFRCLLCVPVSPLQVHRERP